MVVGAVVLAWGCSAQKGADPGDAGGGDVGDGTAVVACLGDTLNNSNPGAIANPTDFSTNPDTGLKDQHTLWMGRADMYRQVKDYTTAGPADHRHLLRLTDAELGSLLGGGTVVVTTDGPPLNTTTGHSHMVTIRPCGITGGAGGSSGAAGTTGTAGTSGS